MDKFSLEQLINPLWNVLKQTSEAVLEIYQESRQFDVKLKSDHSPLTQGDLYTLPVYLAKST